ncbi:MAG: hypothetical protein IPO27_01300 [Bacteroidetes bacterium]|nr:hypothetical protein [Bacteroidota bacterium]
MEWIRLMVLSDLLQAKVILSKLESNNIDCNLIEKKDSSYDSLYSEYEIYVVAGQEHLAKLVVENQ